jgi:precorrin-4 methylase
MDQRKLRPNSASSGRRISSSSAGSAALVAEDAIQDASESAAIREAKIREWMQRKEILDKGLEVCLYFCIFLSLSLIIFTASTDVF